MSLRVACWSALLVMVSPTASSAQLISGRVLIDGTETGIHAASIELVDTTGLRRALAVSDTTGAFRITAPVGGSYRLRVTHIAYASVETPSVQAQIGTDVQVELRLSPAAVVLEPLRVVGRADYNAGWLQEYYDRAIWTRRSGNGRVFFRDEVERESVPRVSSFLTYLLPRGNCRPSLYVDGLPVEGSEALDTALRPEYLEGVELYNNAAFFPPMYQQRGHCAIAFFWTRRDVQRGEKLSWTRVFTAAGVIALLLLLTQL